LLITDLDFFSSPQNSSIIYYSCSTELVSNHFDRFFLKKNKGRKVGIQRDPRSDCCSTSFRYGTCNTWPVTQSEQRIAQERHQPSIYLSRDLAPWGEREREHYYIKTPSHGKAALSLQTVLLALSASSSFLSKGQNMSCALPSLALAFFRCAKSLLTYFYMMHCAVCTTVSVGIGVVSLPDILYYYHYYGIRSSAVLNVFMMMMMVVATTKTLSFPSEASNQTHRLRGYTVEAGSAFGVFSTPTSTIDRSFSCSVRFRMPSSGVLAS